jgi:uncharacterized protein (DUF1501 family)
MLTLASNGRRDCQGQTRRDFLRAGALGLGGLTLPWLLGHKAHAATTGTDYVRDKSVVLIFLAGGASQIETFNPNMDAPAPYHSVTGEVQTTLPGVTFGGTFPALARHAHHMAVVRSFRHPIGNHEQAINHVLTGGTDTNGQGQLGFSMGALATRLRGTNHPTTGMPTYVLLTAPHADPQYSREMNRVTGASRPGPLGATYGPFNPSGGGVALDNMTLNVPAARLNERTELLHQLERLRPGADRPAVRERLGAFEHQALDLLLGGAGRALDLSREDRRVYERYDTTMFQVGKRTFEPSILGQQLLMARRLLEVGAGFITVQSAGWDMHADNNNPGIEEGMKMLGPPLDRALAAFLDDLEQRDLLDRTLVVLTGDFGRTPTINRNGGRDHWASLCTLGLWGGGLRMGQVVGQCDRQNRAPTSAPIGPGNLLSTVMHTLFDVPVLRVTRGVPPNLTRLIEDHRPMAELF